MPGEFRAILTRDRLNKLACWAKGAGLVDLLVRYNPLPRTRVTRVLKAFAVADKDQRRRLAETLTTTALTAARRSAYGRDFSDRLEDWPILTKEAVRDRNGDFFAPTLLGIPAATGGTTGVPVRLLRSPTSVAAEQLFLEHIVAAHGLCLRTSRIAFLRGDIIKPVTDLRPPFGVVSHGGRRLVLSQTHLTPQTIDWYAEALRTFRPDVLWTYPSLVGDLTRLAEERGIPLRLPFVFACSEYMSPSLHRHVAESLGAKVVEYYGQSERVCLAVGEAIERYRFQPAYGRVELLPSEDDLIDDDRRHVRIIATGYWNPALALVRYDTGDLAMVPHDASASELEEIALGLRPFYGIAGRNDEYVVTPEGRKICALSTLVREADNIVQLQIVQLARETVILRVIVGPRFGAADSQRLIANARTKIPMSMDITVEQVSHLETTRYGKAPLTIRRGW